eukprot:TRINITY_DN27127_c0_g1_i1.p1 TRINITY_DN27127_c0_g1~~TRINITY_DN27127_c0_g1_i1.p1  ORF type:complete len:737 (+),score=195.33 TRINITY_DN27127_c0_g1_i1:34-2244(+)
MPTVRQGGDLPVCSGRGINKAPPLYIWVVCSEMPEAAGRFVLQQETRNSMPTWKGGIRYLYCNNGGGWMLASDYEHMDTNRGWLSSAYPHSNMYPDEHVAWEAADGQGGWHPLDSVKITSMPPQAPTAVAINSSIHPEVTGVYYLLPEVYHNGFVVWGCNEKRLYSGEGGWWLVDPDKMHVELDRGLLASATKHGGLMPTEMKDWEAADGTGGWTHDDHCRVVQTVSTPTPPSSVDTPGSMSHVSSVLVPISMQHTPTPGSHFTESIAEIEAKALSEKTASLAEEVGMLRYMMQTKEMRIVSLQEDLHEAGSSFEEKEQRLLEEVKVVRDQLSDTKAHKDLLQTQVDNSELQQGRLRCEILDFKTKVKGLEESNKKYEAALQQASEKLTEQTDEAEAKVSSLQEALQQVTSEQQQTSAEVKDLSGTVSELNANLAIKQQNVDEQSELIKALKKQVDEQAQELLAAKEEIAATKDAAKKDIETAKEAFKEGTEAAKEVARNEIEAAKEAAQEQVHVAEQKAETATAQEQTMASTVAELEEECNSMKGVITAKTVECTALEHRVSETERDLRDSHSLVCALKYETRASYKLVHKQRGALATFRRKTADLVSKNSALHGNLESMTSKHCALDELSAELEACLTTLKGEKQELTNENQLLANDNEGLKERIRQMGDLSEREQENHKQHLDAARRAAEATVQAAADSLLCLIGEAPRGDSMSPVRNPVLQRAKDSLAGWAP